MSRRPRCIRRTAFNKGSGYFSTRRNDLFRRAMAVTSWRVRCASTRCSPRTGRRSCHPSSARPAGTARWPRPRPGSGDAGPGGCHHHLGLGDHREREVHPRVRGAAHSEVATRIGIGGVAGDVPRTRGGQAPKIGSASWQAARVSRVRQARGRNMRGRIASGVGSVNPRPTPSLSGLLPSEGELKRCPVATHGDGGASGSRKSTTRNHDVRAETLSLPSRSTYSTDV